MHVCPTAQSLLVPQAPQAPPTQPCPGSQSATLVHAQLPALHAAVAAGPHCVPSVHAPQTPATQTEPGLQPLFDVQAGAQSPDAQASPAAQSVLTVHVHSSVVCVAVHWALGPHCRFEVHAPQVPAVQTCPAGHWLFDWQAGHCEPVHGMQAVTDSQSRTTPATPQ